MIKLIVILGLLCVEAILMWNYFKWTNERKEIEIDKNFQTIRELCDIIKTKNIKIKELQDEIKRRDDTRLRKNN